MVSLIDLPKYYAPQPLDFSPINKAIGFVADERQRDIANQRAERQLGMEEQKFTEDQRDRMIRRIGARAQVGLELALAGDEPGAKAYYEQHLTSPKIQEALKAHGYNPQDPIGAMRAIHAEALGARQPRDPNDIAYRQAQARQANEHANYYKVLSDRIKAGVDQPPPNVDPTGNLGMDEDGNVILLRRQSQVLGSGTEAPSGTTKEHVDYGPVGTLTTGVPSIVTTPQGRSDMFATQRLMAQRALDAKNQEDRARYIQNMQDRAALELTYGKAPSGFRWNADGTLQDLKDETKKRTSRDKIAALLDDVRTAKDVLTKSNIAERGLAHATGGWIAPEKEEAARAVEHAVQFLTAEVEGKRHANAQDVRMLRFFSPRWNDSTEMIGFKLDQLNRIMQGYFGAKEQPGALFKSMLARANEERLKREGVTPGVSAPKANTAPNGGWSIKRID